MPGSTDNDKQVAKELTLAVIAKITPTVTQGKIDHELLANQTAKVFETIYSSVKKD